MDKKKTYYIPAQCLFPQGRFC